MSARSRMAIRRLTLALVLGVVTTLVVAGPLPPVVQRLRFGEWGTVPALPVSAPRGGPASMPTGSLSHETLADPVTDWRATHWPNGEFVPDWPRDIVEFEWVWRLEVGWPFRAFTGECWGRRDGGFDARGATLIAHPFQRKTLIPLRPLWRGLVLDTGVFSAAWGMLFTMVHLARRVGRRRLGRCPACGYDLRAVPQPGCPECGWQR